MFERVDYIFCSDNYLLRLNKNFLRRDYFTDILSFELNEQFEPLTGEIYISIDRVLENSRLYKTGFKNEILRVIFHGTLHLCGYKDKRPQDVKIMRQKEDLYLDRFKDYISVSRETPQ
jgi:rRNA maturation RNase YbeY